MEAWSTSQRAAASSARSREKREKYEGVWVMLEVGGGETMLRDTVEEIRIDVQLHPCILSFCASFFFSLFFLHYSSFMEVCTKTRWATFIEINVSKVYFYIESSKV